MCVFSSDPDPHSPFDTSGTDQIRSDQIDTRYSFIVFDFSVFNSRFVVQNCGTAVAMCFY